MTEPSDDVDQQRFTALFDAHFGDIWRYARRRTESADAADDVTAQVFAVAWRRRNDLPTADARLWLFGVARNVVANERRSSTRLLRLRAKLAQQPLPVAGSDNGPAAAGSGSPVLSLAILNPLEREAVELRYWDELSVADIAVLLGCSPNAVSMRLHKARKKLAAQRSGKPPQVPRPGIGAKDLLADGHVGTVPTAGMADAGKDERR